MLFQDNDADEISSIQNGGKVYANGIPNEAVTVDPELEKRQSLGFVDCACIRAAPNGERKYILVAVLNSK